MCSSSRCVVALHSASRDADSLAMRSQCAAGLSDSHFHCSYVFTSRKMLSSTASGQPYLQGIDRSVIDDGMEWVAVAEKQGEGTSRSPVLARGGQRETARKRENQRSQNDERRACKAKVMVYPRAILQSYEKRSHYEHDCSIRGVREMATTAQKRESSTMVSETGEHCHENQERREMRYGSRVEVAVDKYVSRKRTCGDTSEANYDGKCNSFPTFTYGRRFWTRDPLSNDLQHRN